MACFIDRNRNIGRIPGLRLLARQIRTRRALAPAKEQKAYVAIIGLSSEKQLPGTQNVESCGFADAEAERVAPPEEPLWRPLLKLGRAWNGEAFTRYLFY